MNIDDSKIKKLQGDRTTEAKNRRIKAASVAAARPQATQENNGEEALAGFPGNFKKGLEHGEDGFLVDDRDYQAYRCAVLTGLPQNFDAVTTASLPEGVGRRKWESPAAGFVFDLQGADAQSVTMPPAPQLDSEELTAEMAEVYAMAALRDVPFSKFPDSAPQWIDKLNKLPWFGEAYEKRRDREYRVRAIFGKKGGRFLGRGRRKVTLDNFFRGVTTGDEEGTYISQFLLIGNPSRGADANTADPKQEWDETAGKIVYGANAIEQRVRVATCGVDFMTDMESWRMVQNGANFSQDYRFDYNRADYTSQGQGDPNQPNFPAYRFILTPRDLATYVHFDQLYQPYLNACLIMLGRKVPFDPGFSKLTNGINRQGFAQFGGPHVLSLVTEVAVRALKAVRFQKFNLHNRTRPEAIGGLFEQLRCNNSDARLEPLRHSWETLRDGGFFPQGNHFLPMAFPEGSPMHPSYGAGHGIVAGACVTMLKAFFNHEAELVAPGCAYEADPATEGRTLRLVKNSPALKVEGELNKLASNISIGRNIAGVHYFSDYLESIRLGELIAISILEEQALMYNRLQFPFKMTVPLYDGGWVTIGTKS